MCLKFEEYLSYADGELYWLPRKGNPGGFNTQWAGKIAGNIQPVGYKVLEIKGKAFYNHKVVFYLHTKRWPEVVDHIDGDPLNNDIENLREATPQLNTTNRKRNKNNTSGYCGVKKENNRWRAVIYYQKICYNLGNFLTKEEAIVARQKKEIEFGFTPRGNLY